ncbi:FecR family protein [Euzebyella marina]|uniref:FecR family protein n=1 Tax=Euzebyella marina TaxID=1761453 RepID=A0A3G2L6Q2_9FLAO|nr:FecR domain-containing protein [Euzebyella marina]AYN67944.1 FecR family protein [Euzebyella marina]
MRFSNFEIQLAKYLTNAISSEELDELNGSLSKSGNHNVFRTYLEIDFFTRHVMSEYNTGGAKKKLLDTIRKDKRKVRRLHFFQFVKYAAVLLVCLTAGYFYWDHNFNSNFSQVSENPESQITLQLSDGSIKTISEAGNASVYDKDGTRVGLQQGNQLIYHKGKKAKKLVYNTVNVPYGKRFVLILSDGTKAHLNAGSSLRYPVEFIEGKSRQIFLTGEGFFDVSEDKNSPFIINANELNIRVLGTKFNLSAYPEDENIRTVLVEGSVGFYDSTTDFDETSRRLVPGEMAIWEKELKTIEFRETNTDLFTGWMDGRIIFSHMPFEDITKKLERNYNVIIQNNYQELNDIRFNASFDTETISQVFEAFNKNYPMKFTVTGKNVIIEKP